MSSDPFVGEIAVVAFNFAPRGWAFCAGQLLPISQNTALFSLLGTTYGGDGKSTFALPNFQGNFAIAPGQGPGLSLYDLGQEGGTTNVSLLQSEIPGHIHTMSAGTANANTNTASGSQLAKGFKGNLQSSNSARFYSAVAPAAGMAPTALSPTGGSQPHNNMMPYLTLNYIIALQGVFPPRT